MLLSQMFYASNVTN